MAKPTKRGYKEGRPKRDNEEDSDDNASRSNDEDYNYMLGNNDDEEEDDEDEYDRDKYSNSKKGKEQVRVIGKSKDIVSVAEVERRWAERLDQTKDLCDEYKKDNILLRAELRAAKGSRETTKTKMRIQLEWNEEEANLSENVANYCRTHLFPCFKFLKDKWDVFDPEHPKSLSNFVKKQIKIPELADYRDMGEGNLSINMFEVHKSEV
jgi:hypothetical protein